MLLAVGKLTISNKTSYNDAVMLPRIAGQKGLGIRLNILKFPKLEKVNSSYTHKSIAHTQLGSNLTYTFAKQP